MSASACDGIWLLDDDVSMLKALGRLMNSAGFVVEKFNHPAAFLAKPFDDEFMVQLVRKAAAS